MCIHIHTHTHTHIYTHTYIYINRVGRKVCSSSPYDVMENSNLSSEVAHSCLILCDPMDCSLPGSSIHGISRARVLEWVAISFSRGSSPPRDRTQVSHRRFSQPSIYGMVTICMTHGQHRMVDMSDDSVTRDGEILQQPRLTEKD